MGRRSSRPSGGRRAASPRAPARSASTAARRSTPAPPPAARRTPSTRVASNAPATKQNNSASPPAVHQPQQGSAMGGFMANIASTGLGVMAGRAMDRAFFGGASSAPQEYESDNAAPTYESSEGYSVQPTELIEESVCAREAMEFKKCMERSSNSVSACQWNIDVLAACQQQQQQQLGFADAGRL